MVPFPTKRKEREGGEKPAAEIGNVTGGTSSISEKGGRKCTSTPNGKFGEKEGKKKRQRHNLQQSPFTLTPARGGKELALAEGK